MPDAIYDAVVIGGGHNGLVTACYLANAGMTVAVLERQHEIGGGACSEELPLPGFLSNPCANFHTFYRNPAWQDFKLWEKGARYGFSDIGAAAIFDDGTCLQGYPSMTVADPITCEERAVPGGTEKMLREIARFSERDAETGSVLIEKYQRKWGAALTEWVLNPPLPWGERDAIERLFDDPEDGIDPRYQVMTIKEVAYDLFESSELRTYFIRSAMSTSGCFPNDVLHVVDALHQVMVVLSIFTPASPVGGTHALAHALQKTLSEMGGKFFVHHEVDKVLIDNGVARGVRLTDGTEVGARKLVVSNVDPHQTLFRFVGEDHISPQLAMKVKNISYDGDPLFWAHFAVHELPKWKAADFNPDCLRAGRADFMPNDPETLADKHQAEVLTRGIPEKLYVLAGIDSLLDKTRAPQGKHNILLEQLTAPLRYFSESQWLKMKRDIVNEMVRQWQWYAPNMTWDNIIASYCHTPSDVVKRNINMREGCTVGIAQVASQMGRFRPCPELAQYRTPIKGFYMCGASMHYGGRIHGRNGYNCYKILAEDFGLRKVWEERGRPY